MAITNFQGVTLIAAIETFLLVKVLPGRFIPQDVALSRVILPIFSMNYFLLFVYSMYIFPNFISPLRKFPRPKYWLPRMIYSRLSATTAPGQLFVELEKETPNDGIIALPALTTTRLLLTKPSPLADILVHHPYEFVKPRKIRNFLRKILGDGLIIVEGDQHKFLRKNTLPAFSFRHIKDLYPMMWTKSLTFTDALEEDIKQQQTQRPYIAPHDIEKEGSSAATGKAEISSWASKVTLDVIGIAGLGREFNVLKNSDDQLAKDYEAILEPSREKFLFFIAATWISFRFVQMLPWRMNETFRQRTTSLKNICNSLVREKREAVMKKGDENFNILSLLIKSNNFSDSELSDQLLTYLAAGHETTSSAFTWACYLLAVHPKLQSTLRAEVREAFPVSEDISPDKDIAGKMERLPYLNGIINETLRLYPTVPVTIRVAQSNTHLAGHRIPKGTEILISPWLINRSAELWGPDAKVFKPERWIDDGRPNNMGGATSNYDYLTFLHGPRSCIGQNFAKAEIRCLIAAMVRRFEWELDMDEKDIIPGGAITIKPTKGLHVKLRTVPE